jgi:uncharacterized membrane protein YqaE (UPF0057 family)
VLWRILFALWSQPGRIRSVGHGARTKQFALNIVLALLGFFAVERL